jgi:hypothetical protein
MFCRDCERHIDETGRPFVGGRCPACDREERRREQDFAQQANEPVGEVHIREDFFSRDRRRRIQVGVDEAGREFTRSAWIDGSGPRTKQVDGPAADDLRTVQRDTSRNFCAWEPR